MNINILVAVAGMFTSLAFGLIPQLKVWFDKKDSMEKSSWMILFALVAGVLAVTFSCLFKFTFVECSPNGIQSFFEAFFAFFMANQATFTAGEPIYKKNV